jgi:hypothetical protein
VLGWEGVCWEWEGYVGIMGCKGWWPGARGQGVCGGCMLGVGGAGTKGWRGRGLSAVPHTDEDPADFHWYSYID